MYKLRIEPLECRNLLAVDVLAGIQTRLPDTSRIHEFVTLSSGALIQAGGHVWYSDGTTEGTVQSSNLPARRLVFQNDEIALIRDSRRVWITDGTDSGTYATDIGVRDYVFQEIDGLLYFTTQVIKEDGSRVETLKTLDIATREVNAVLERPGRGQFASITQVGQDALLKINLWNDDLFELQLLQAGKVTELGPPVVVLGEIVALGDQAFFFGPGSSREMATANLYRVADQTVELAAEIELEREELPYLRLSVAGDHSLLVTSPTASETQHWRFDTATDSLSPISLTDPCGVARCTVTALPAGTLIADLNGVRTYDEDANLTSPLLEQSDVLVVGDYAYLYNKSGIWKTDGTASGTQKISDVSLPARGPGKGGEYSHQLAFSNGTLLYQVTDPEAGAELFGVTEADGTGQLIKELIRTSYLSGVTVAQAVTLGQKLVVHATTSSADEFLILENDGNQPIDLRSLHPDLAESEIAVMRGGTLDGRSFFAHRDGLLFATRADQQDLLWFTDGTAEGTREVHRDGRIAFHDLHENPGVFRSQSTDGTEALWYTAGTPDSTVQLTDKAVVTGIGDIITGKQSSYFQATGTDGPIQIWHLNRETKVAQPVSGLPAFDTEFEFLPLVEERLQVVVETATVSRLFDVDQGEATELVLWKGSGRFSVFAAAHFDGKDYFSISTNREAQRIWVRDQGSESLNKLDTVDVAVREFWPSGKRLALRTSNGDLYTTDGTNEGTVLLWDSQRGTDVSGKSLEVTDTGSVVRFRVPPVLIQTDGTVGGTLVLQQDFDVRMFRIGNRVLAQQDESLFAFEVGKPPVEVRFQGANERIQLVSEVPDAVVIVTKEEWTQGRTTRRVYLSDGTTGGTFLLDSIADERFSEFHHGFQRTESSFATLDTVYFLGGFDDSSRTLWSVDLDSIADVNSDKRLDAKDVDAVVSAISEGHQDVRFDVNQDGKVDVEDANAIVTTHIQTKLGDLDLNGRVDFEDFLSLSSRFGKQEAVWADGDLDHDGNVGYEDFLLLSANFGFDRFD